MFAFKYRLGADISGGQSPGGLPRAVLCPNCSAGLLGAYWLLLAESGAPLDHGGWEKAARWGIRCEGCGLPAGEWPNRCMMF